MLNIFSNSKNEVALRKDVDNILAKMEQLTIANNDQFEETGAFVQGIKGKQKEVKDQYEEKRIQTYARYKTVTTEIASYIDPLVKAERIVKQKLGDYRTEMELKQRVEIAKKLAIAEAEAEERQLSEAEETGDDSTLDDELIIPQPVGETEVPAMKGVSFTTVWKFEIVDARLIPYGYMIPDERKIRDFVKAMKGTVGIPGIRMYSEQQVGARVR